MAAAEEGLTFADPDPSIRRGAVDRIEKQIKLAAELKSAVISVSVNGHLGDDVHQRPIRREAALACLKKCCCAAALAGVTVLLEPLNRYECDYLNSLEEGLSLINEIDLFNLKLLADTFHMNIEEADVGMSLRLAGSHLGHVHMADSNRQAPGNGHLDVRGVLEVLREIRYQGYLSLGILLMPNSRKAAEDAIRCVGGILSGLSVDI